MAALRMSGDLEPAIPAQAHLRLIHARRQRQGWPPHPHLRALPPAGARSLYPCRSRLTRAGTGRGGRRIRIYARRRRQEPSRRIGGNGAGGVAGGGGKARRQVVQAG